MPLSYFIWNKLLKTLILISAVNLYIFCVNEASNLNMFNGEPNVLVDIKEGSMLVQVSFVYPEQNHNLQLHFNGG